LLIKNNIE